ncbi:MAG: bifunctional 2-C-methyl-D-erythritol 4-phosphate cytidylyltransferase/2-C-methyl-D-erythritol 2,4-cyclodiphosphate synthase [Paracoccaceae bacterium]
MTGSGTQSIAAVIVAAGRGTRAGGDIPKQWQQLAGRTVAEWTLQAFAAHPGIGQIVLVIHPEDRDAAYLPALPEGVVLAEGGASRDASVLNGLRALKAPCDLVLIHDVARPCIRAEVIDRVIAALANATGAAPALAVTDALWRGAQGHVDGTQARDGLFRAQTPQGFHFKEILAAHEAHRGGAADDVEVARAAGISVAIVEGDAANLKITTPQDFARAAAQFAQVAQLESKMDIRTGNGFDVHRFGPGDHVTLCGIDIAHDRALQGHSDADVGLHTITDAIYGALARGDIGQHFPPSDPQWKGAASHIFLEHARDLATEMGFAITHVDCTLICEAPKIGPHAAAMRAEVAALLRIDAERVSVKATTSERLGFTGRGEGIACLATATLVRA